jgi:hypothetical protein
MSIFRRPALVLMAGVAAGAAMIAFAPPRPSTAGAIIGPAGFATLVSLPVIFGVMCFRLARTRRWGVFLAAVLVAGLGSVAGLVAGLSLRVELGLPI